MLTRTKPGTIETPVLIVGAGPVGLGLAADLGARGVPCVVVEQGDGSSDHPRASALNSRSMEFMRRWGIAGLVRDAAAPDGFPHTALYCTSLAGYEIARIERPHHGGKGATATSAERAQRCNQLWLDPILRDLASSHGDTRFLYSWRLDKLDQRGDCVLAEVSDLNRGSERRLIAAQIAIDCSGGHSVIRDRLRIGMSGSDHVGHHVSIFVRIPELWRHHDKGAAALISFVDATGIWRNLVMLDGRELYRLGLRGKVHWDAPEAIDTSRMLAEAIGVPVEHEIISVKRWTARNVVADRYGEGRIILAGDAAHLAHPAAGLGLNTGLGDAFDLGWKIEGMLAGWGTSGLLDSYERERRPVAQRNVAHSDASHGRDRKLKSHPEIALDTPAGARAREEMSEVIAGSQRQKLVTDGIALGYRYGGSPITVADGTREPPNPVSEYQPTTWPGARSPHAVMPNGGSTIDLYGRGFMLLRLGTRAPEPNGLERAFAHRGVPLACRTIDDPAISALHERRLVLVRPDGHVAWRGDQPPLDPLAVVDRVRGAA